MRRSLSLLALSLVLAACGGNVISSGGNNPLLPLGVTHLNRAYVTTGSSDTVVPINLAANTPGTPIPVPGNTYSIAITPDGKTAYVTTGTSGNVVPIDLTTNTPRPSISLPGATSASITIPPDGKTAYAAGGDVGVVPIDLATNTPGTPIPVPSAYYIAITPDGKTAYVTTDNGIGNDTAGSNSVVP